jgi:hypothetical protein
MFAGACLGMPGILDDAIQQVETCLCSSGVSGTGWNILDTSRGEQASVLGIPLT